MLQGQAPKAAKPKRPRRRPTGRQLACPKHPDQPLLGNGRKYFLHLLTSEELVARGMPAGKAKLVINAYPVLVLSNEWLEELYCASCGQKRWYHLIKAADGAINLRLASRDLWSQANSPAAKPAAIAIKSDSLSKAWRRIHPSGTKRALEKRSSLLPAV